MIKVPDRFLPIEAGSTAAVTCEVFSHPPSVITWIRAFGGLPKGRTSVKNGKLSIENFSKEDSETYVCTARNKLGSVSAVTTLGFQRKPGNCKIKKSTLSCLFTFRLSIALSFFLSLDSFFLISSFLSSFLYFFLPLFILIIYSFIYYFTMSSCFFIRAQIRNL